MRRLLVAVAAVLSLQAFEMTPAAQQPSRRIALFDGVSLKGWTGNPVFWSVKDGAIHGATNETRGELLLTDGNYGDFRLVLKSRLVSESNHLGVCFWGERLADFRYGDCVLVIPPHGGMWDYRPAKGARRARTFLTPKPTRTNGTRPKCWATSRPARCAWR